MKTILILLMSLSLAFSQAPDLNRLLSLDGVKDVKVETYGICVIHSSGIKRIPIEQLPTELVEYYRFNSLESIQAKQDFDKKNADRITKQTQEAELNKKSEKKFFTVVQVLGDGLTVYEVEYLGRVIPEPLIRDSKILFVRHSKDTKQLVDGDFFCVTVVGDGIIQLRSIDGAISTVTSYKTVGGFKKNQNGSMP